MNTEQNKLNDDEAGITEQVGETNSSNKVTTELAETDVEVAAAEIATAGLSRKSGLDEFEQNTVKRLRGDTGNALLKSLLNCYLSGRFDSDAFQSAIRLALSDEDPEETAIRHLRSITTNSVLKFLLTRYQDGDLQGEVAQGVIQLLASTQEPVLGAASYLRSITSDPFLKLLLSHYANCELQGERAQDALRLALPTTEPEADAVNYLRKITGDKSLKSLLTHYLSGGLQSERTQAALRLAFSTTEPEADAVNYLRKITGDKSLKSLLTLYLSGGLQSERTQAALRLAFSTAEPEADAIARLRAVTDSHLLRTFLTLYQDGKLSDPSIQAAVQLALPESQHHKESQAPAEGAMPPAMSDDSKRRATNGLQNDRQFIVINSFPKSGNTWVRSFISHLCFDGSLTSVPDDHTQNMLEAPEYRLPDGRLVRFYKSHGKNLISVFRGRAIIHAAAIHICRHPLDVFFSYLNFMHLPQTERQGTRSIRRDQYFKKFSGVDEIVESGMLDAFFGVFLLYGTLRPEFFDAGSWYENMRYWSSDFEDECPIFRLRYEELLANQAQEFLAIGEFLGKNKDDVQRAFLAAQEATAIDGQFFWKQRSGIYKEYLNSQQIEKYDSLFGDELKSYGYRL